MKEAGPIIDRNISRRANMVWRLLLVHLMIVVIASWIMLFDGKCDAGEIYRIGKILPSLAQAAEHSFNPCFFARLGVVSLIASVALSGVAFYWLLHHRGLQFRTVGQKAKGLAMSGGMLLVFWVNLTFSNPGPYSLADGRSSAALYIATSSYYGAVPFLGVFFGCAQLGLTIATLMIILAPVNRPANR